MASALLTSTLAGEIASQTAPFDFSAMPGQSLVAIAQGSNFQLTYNRNFNGRAPSLASAITAVSPLQLGAKGQSILLQTTTGVDLNTAAATLLYTVPAGKTAIIRRVIMRNASISLTTASISFGWNSASFNNVITNATRTALTSSALYLEILPINGAAIGAAAGTFKVLVNTPQGAAATCTIDVFGYLI
jgi:hypothetical protein